MKEKFSIASLQYELNNIIEKLFTIISLFFNQLVNQIK